METPLSRNTRAPVEQIYRAILKNYLQNETPSAPSPTGRLGIERVLPPHLGEMGAEVRYHLARAEPWLRNGWKIVTRRPAFYPEGTTVAAPGFFEAVDALFSAHGVMSGYNGICITPVEFGDIQLGREVTGKAGKLTLGLSDLTKVMLQSRVEIMLRRLFLEWFYHDGRPITDYDRHVLSFCDATVGNWQYHASAALRPGYLPPAFVEPPEPRAPHVGVQIRKVPYNATRDSDPAWMMATGAEIAAHLGLPLLVYGHPNGCHLPTSVETTWNPRRSEGHLERELGYLSSCRLMLSPDSGWADLMGWLEVPTLLELQATPGEFEPLRAGFRPRIDLICRSRPIGPQVDELLAAKGPVLPATPAQHFIDPQSFPWEP